MRIQTYSAQLAHPPAVVSAFLSKLENDPLWRSEITSAELVNGASGRVGAKYREVVTWEGIRAAVPLEVREHAPGERLVLVSEEPGYTGVSEYRFAENGGGTSLTLTQSVETTGALKLVEPFMWGVITRWLDRDIGRIEAAISATQSQE